LVSQAEAAGEVVALPSLADIQGQSFGRPTVLVTQQVGGVEDIPVRFAHIKSSPHKGAEQWTHAALAVTRLYI
jgi:hypothetical protein